MALRDESDGKTLRIRNIWCERSPQDIKLLIFELRDLLPYPLTLTDIDNLEFSAIKSP